MVAHPALSRPTPVVVLCTVALEDANCAVVHAYGNGDGQNPLRPAEALVNAGVQRQPLGGDVQLLLGDLEKIEFLLHEMLLELFRSRVHPRTANPPIRGHTANFRRIIVAWERLV